MTAGDDVLRRSVAAICARPAVGDFFQTVTLLQESCRGATAVGEAGPPGEEAIRFQANLSLSFADSDIAAVDWDEECACYRVTINCFGLYGPASPLPTFYTEHLLAEDDRGETAQRQLFDLLNHRLTSLLVRAWQRHRLAAHDPQDSRLARRLRHLAGPADMIGEWGLIGSLRRRPGTVASLTTLLRARFPDVPMTVESCLLRWSAIDADQRCRLGSDRRLGVDTMLGRRLRNRTLTFGLCLGPLSDEQLAAFLPGGEADEELRRCVDLVNGDYLDWECELLVPRASLPPTRLDGGAALGRRSRLAGQGPDQYRIRIRHAAAVHAL